MKTLSLCYFMFASFLGFSQSAVIEDWQLEIEIEDEKNLTITSKKRVTIKDEKGYQEALLIQPEDAFTKLTKVSMVLFDSHGEKVKKLGRHDSRDWNFNQGFELDDSHIVFLHPEYRHYPFTIEIETEIKMNNGFLNLPRWTPRNKFDLEVQNASLIIKKPTDLVVKYFNENIDPVIKSTKVDEDVWTWSVSNLPSIEDDVSYKQFISEQPKVYLSPLNFNYDDNPGNFASWKNFGNWYLDLNNDEFEFIDETVEFLGEIKASNKEQVVADIYEYMQARTRYISIQLGIGGFKSLPTQFVDSKGYGDCKALSTYMKSMLAFKGINSHYILVNAGRDVEDIEHDFVSNQFNHVFLGVPIENDTVFLECTSQILPYGFTGTFTDDRHVLWLDRGRSDIMKMPALDSEMNSISSRGDIKLDKYGNASLSLSKRRNGGFYENISYLNTLGKDQMDGYLYKQFDFKDFVINDFSFQEVDEQPSYDSKYEISVNNLARNASNKLILPVNVLGDVDKFFTHNKYEKFAEVRRAFFLEETVIIHLPNGLYPMRIPEKGEITSDYGQYELEVKDLEDGRIEITRRIVFEKGTYMKEAFEPFNKFYQELKKLDKTNLVFVEGT